MPKTLKNSSKNTTFAKNNFKLLQKHEDILRDFRTNNDMCGEIEYLTKTCKIVNEYLSDPPNERRKELIMDYCMVLGLNVPTFAMKKTLQGFCKKCGGYLIDQTKESHYTCEECGLTEVYLDDTMKTASFDHQQHVCFRSQYTYERKSHLKEELEQCQGIEQNTIPQHVLDVVLLQCLKDKITTMKGFRKQDMRRILKKTKLSAYYKHAVKIIRLLGGDAGLDLSEDEEMIHIMFQKIQPLFDEYKHLLDDDDHQSSVRQNFLNYRYTIRKFLELLKYQDDELNDYFPFIQNPKKLAKYDIVWKLICGRTGWKFIPSI